MANTNPQKQVSPPAVCDTCGAPISKVFYDARTEQGSWACMCMACFTQGPGLGELGSGRGQEYTQQGPHWIKTAG